MIPISPRVAALAAALALFGTDRVVANQQPTAVDDVLHRSLPSLGLVPVRLNDSDPDGDPLMISATTAGVHGTTAVNGGFVAFTPSAGYDGNDSFTYTVADGNGGFDTANVTLINAVPVAMQDLFTVSAGTTSFLNILANDQDADFDDCHVHAVTQGAHGAVQIVNAGHRVTYTPDAGFFGTDTFTYEMNDGCGGEATATVTVLVQNPDPETTLLYTRGGAVPGAGALGSNIPAGATWVTFGIPAINDAGQIAVFARWTSPSGSGGGIFLDDVLLIKLGDVAPGAGANGLPADARIRVLRDPVLGSSGGVAAVGLLAGTGLTPSNDSAIISWDAAHGVTELIAREGGVAPGTNGAIYKSFGSVRPVEGLHASGAWFTASLVVGSGFPAVTSGNDLGGWLVSHHGNELLVREGGVAAGLGAGEVVKTFSLFKTTSGSPGQGRGQADGQLAILLKLSSGRTVLARTAGNSTFSADASSNTLIGSGSLAGGKWRSFGVHSVNPDGFAVRATLVPGFGGISSSNSSGIFAPGFLPVALLGQTAPGTGGATFGNFSEPLLGEAGGTGVAFAAGLRGPAVTTENNSAIFWRPEGAPLQLVAREGAAPPDSESGSRWKAFTSVALPASGPAGRGPVFSGSLLQGFGNVTAANDLGAWGVDSTGAVRTIVREGAILSGKTVRNFVFLKSVSGALGQTRAFNAGGMVVFRARFTDGSSAVIKTVLP